MAGTSSPLIKSPMSPDSNVTYVSGLNRQGLQAYDHDHSKGEG